MDPLLSSDGSLDVCVQPWKSMPSHLAMVSFEGTFFRYRLVYSHLIGTIWNRAHSQNDTRGGGRGGGTG